MLAHIIQGTCPLWGLPYKLYVNKVFMLILHRNRCTYLKLSSWLDTQAPISILPARLQLGQPHFLCNKKEVNDEVDFCMQLSMKTYYKLILWFWWRWSSISKVPKIASLQCLQYLKKEVRDEVDFLHADKHQSGLQVDFNTLVTKFGYKVILWLSISLMKHSQITQSNNFANPCNISKTLGLLFFACR